MRCARIILSLGVLGLAGETLRAQEQERRESLAEFLLRIARDYDVPGVFRFDPPAEQGTKEPIYHQPEAMGFEIEREVAKLPRAGDARRVPWTAWWWPMNANGIAARSGATASPIEKYAQAFGVSPEARAWEMKHHGTEGGHRTESWWGHCNGWAAAAALEDEPLQAAEWNGVRFEPADIKALLTEAYFGCRAIGADERYTGERRPSLDRFGRPEDPAFRDVNPGALHLLLGNLLGREGRVVIVDLAAGAEVWNHPVSAFEVLELRDLGGAAAAVRAISGQPWEGEYPFNPAARKWLQVKLRMRITRALSSASAAGEGRGEQARSGVDLTYVLETDAAGRIIGGEWSGASRLDHPDFIWVPVTPSSSFTISPDGLSVVGTSGNANPYVVYEEVRLLQGRSREASAAAGTRATAGRDVSVSAGRGRWDRSSEGVPPATIRTFQLADQQVRQQQLEEAIATMNEALQTAPEADPRRREELLLRRGWLRFLGGKPEDGLRDYSGIGDDGLRAPTVLARRSLMLTAKGDHARGLAEAARAIEMNPKNPWGWCARGWLYLSRKAEEDAVRAEQDFARARSLGADPFLEFSSLQCHQAQTGQAQAGRQIQIAPGQLPARMVRPFAGSIQGLLPRQVPPK